MASTTMKTLTLSDGTYNNTLPMEDSTARAGLQNKVDKVTGKGLSTNDYTDAEKTKLAGIATGATANIGTVTAVKVNGTTNNPNSSGVVDLGNISGGGGGGDVNVIESVKVNGTALTPDSNKAVNINDIPWSIVSSKPTIPDISGKADKVTSATSGNFASLDANGNLADSGHKHSDYLTSHQDISGKADKVSGASNGNLAGLNSSGNITDSSIASSDVTDAVGKKHTHSNKTVLDYIPSSLGTSGQALCVNSSANGLEFKTISGGGGLSNYDFTHTGAQGVSGTVTVTFAANTRGSRMMTATADIGLAIVCNNSADNYIWIKNTGSADIDVTISSVTYNNSSLTSGKIFLPEDGITVPKGNVCEIGVICNNDGAFITARADMKANS